MVVVTFLIAVLTTVTTAIAPLSLVAIISYETNTKYTGDNCGNKTDEGPDNSDNKSKKCVRDQNRIRTCFRRRDQKRHTGRTGRTLIAHLGNYWHNRATAKRHGHANRRTCTHRFQTVFAQPSQNGFTRDKYVNQARKK